MCPEITLLNYLPHFSVVDELIDNYCQGVRDFQAYQLHLLFLFFLSKFRKHRLLVIYHTYLSQVQAHAVDMRTLVPEAGIYGMYKWLYPIVKCGM